MSDKRNVKDTLRRVGWLSLAIIFLVTALGIGVVAFWQATNQSDNSSIEQSKTTLQGQNLPNFTPLAKVDQLQIIDLKPGSGSEVKAEATVTAHYTGALATNGVIFQSSLDAGQPFVAALNQVIPGWKEGMLGMKAGGERRLIIPAALGYGANPPPGSGIPANADLVFDIILISVQ